VVVVRTLASSNRRRSKMMIRRRRRRRRRRGETVRARKQHFMAALFDNSDIKAFLPLARACERFLEEEETSASAFSL